MCRHRSTAYATTLRRSGQRLLETIRFLSETMTFGSVRLQFQQFNDFVAQLLNFVVVGSELYRTAC